MAIFSFIFQKETLTTFFPDNSSIELYGQLSIILRAGHRFYSYKSI